MIPPFFIFIFLFLFSCGHKTAPRSNKTYPTVLNQYQNIFEKQIKEEVKKDKELKSQN